MSRMMTLRAERDDLMAQAKAITDRYADKPMPRAEQEKFDGLMNRVDELTADLQTSLAALDAEADNPSGAAWRVDGREVPVLRNTKDIRRYYATREPKERGQGFARGGDRATLADFMRGVAGMPTTEVVRASLAGGTDSAGGYLLPSVVMPQILEALVPASAVLTAGAGIIPVDEGAKSYTQTAVDTIPTAAWRDENGAVAESEPTFRGVPGVPRSLAFYFKISRELLADASNVEQALLLAISQAFAKALDLAALRGSGTAPEPRGIRTTSGIISVTNGGAGASLATTKYANLFSAVQQLLEANAPMPTAAVMSPRSRLVLGALTDSTGQPLQMPQMLQPLAMLTTSQVPNNLTVGASTDCSEIYVGVFSRMALLMREQVSVQLLREVFATTGQVGFLCHVRVDVLVQYPKAFALVTGVRP